MVFMHLHLSHKLFKNIPDKLMCLCTKMWNVWNVECHFSVFKQIGYRHWTETLLTKKRKVYQLRLIA